MLCVHNKSGAKRTNLIVCHEKKEDDISVLQLIGTKRNVEFLKTPLSPSRDPHIGWKGRGRGVRIIYQKRYVFSNQ